jgi:hypothetical protein
MVSIGKLGRGQERYYLDKVAEGAEDYYSGEGETEGYWLGDAADDLGLYGEVGPEQLTTMLISPSTPRPWETARSARGTRPTKAKARRESFAKRFGP